MILEHGLDDLTARWNTETNAWDIGQKIKYRWIDNKNKPTSDWFYELREALDWIVHYDYTRETK